MKWKDVTLRQFLELQKLIDIEDETDRMVAIAELFLGDEVTSLPIDQFGKKLQELNFLKEELPTNRLVKSVTVNDRKYKIDALVGHINTAQYIDFVNHMKDGNQFARVLSVFFIPDGHKYNDGYDMGQVIDDMYDLPMDIVNSESFFFKRQFSKFIEIFQSYSLKQLKKTDLPKDVKKNLEIVIKGSTSLAFSHLS